MNYLAPSFNPMAGNPLRTRSDVVKAIRDLYQPLLPYYSAGGARIRLDMAAAHYDRAASDMEGFARPLWGLAPLAVGGGAEFVDWELFRKGLANGTDPDHPEYWGAPEFRDQRLVELAPIGFALALIPEILWEPQSSEAKQHIATYLRQAYGQYFGENNWKFFRLIIGLGLQAIGEPVDPALAKDALRGIEQLYLDDGWYRDGPVRRADYYVSFAMHFYGLLYGRLGGDEQQAKIYQQRAAAFAPQFLRWFSGEGAALAFGRSMTYRFACSAFWSALAFAELPAIPWGQIKGLLLRHLRWWSRYPIAHRDGVLSIGYGYPNLHMCETYNSAASPYWAFKFFIFLALPPEHPFWQAEEEALPAFPEASVQRQPGMILFHPPGDVIALAGGQEETRKFLRHGPEKYSKFAYSGRYAFGIESDLRQFNSASLENMLGFSCDGRHFRVRESNELVRIAANVLYAKWTPDTGIVVETWLLPASPWHIRVHRIRSIVACQIIEGGFAINRPDNDLAVQEAQAAACVRTYGDFSGIRDLGSTVLRTGRILDALPNSNLLHARSLVPQLLGEIFSGETVLTTAVLALGCPDNGQASWEAIPRCPELTELEELVTKNGKAVSVMELND